MIEVRTMKLSLHRDKEEHLYRIADKKRRQKASRYVQADDRLRCLMAGCLMKHCLPGYTEAQLWTGSAGKPFLRNGVPFSLSHGGNYVVLAWCEESEGIGVDVEPIQDMEYYRPILPLAMKPEEIKAVGEEARMAVRIWTRKESLYKCIGEGISGFQELPALLEDQVLFSGALCRLRSWEDQLHSFSLALRGYNGMMDLRIQEEILS